MKDVFEENQSYEQNYCKRNVFLLLLMTNRPNLNIILLYKIVLKETQFRKENVFEYILKVALNILSKIFVH